MDPFLAAARTTFRQQQRAFETVIAGLPVDALDWQPARDANSLTVLVTHAWGAAQAWTVRAAGREMARDRAAEFRAKADAAALQTLLAEGARASRPRWRPSTRRRWARSALTAWDRRSLPATTCTPEHSAFSMRWNTPRSISGRPT